MIKLRVTGSEAEVESFRREILGKCNVTYTSGLYHWQSGVKCRYFHLESTGRRLRRPEFEAIYGPLPKELAELSDDVLGDLLMEVVGEIMTAGKGGVDDDRFRS